MTYFIKKTQELSDRNKLDADIAAFMKKYDHMLVPSKEYFDDFIITIKIKAAELNNMHSRIQKKIDIRTREESTHVYITISDQLSFIAYKVSQTYSPF